MIPNIPALFEACLEYQAYRHPWRGASLEDKSPEARAIRQTAHRYEEMKSRLESAWAAYYGLIEAGGDRSWDRLVGKLHTRRCWDRDLDYPPNSDHTSLWRIKGQHSRFAQVFVSQPYGYEHNLEAMKTFATKKNLWFWVSKRPAWHYPGSVDFVEWSAPWSEFAKKRSTAEAHRLWQTVEEWRPALLN